MSEQDIAKVATKIVKRLKSKDDNEKLAALSYLTKVFPTPKDLAESKYGIEVWNALRSTQFLERAIHGEETKNLVLLIISTFSHGICPPKDLLPFIPLLSNLSKNNYQKEESQCLIEISQSLDDISIIFEYNEINLNFLPFFVQCLSNAKSCQMTSAVFRARTEIFKLLSSINEDLIVRQHLFLIIAYMTRLNDQFAIYSAKSKIDIERFLVAQRLAQIEIRLQLDVPLNYKELEMNEKKRAEMQEKEDQELLKRHHKGSKQYEDGHYPIDDNDDDEGDVYIGRKQSSSTSDEKNQKEKIDPKPFTQNIGPLINPEISAASCQLMEYLITPLLNHEDELNDSEVNKYFTSVDTIISDTVAIFDAVVGQRDKDRNDLKCLISIFASWLREAPFLCENAAILKSLKNIISMLWWFPSEALQCIPAFSTWAESKNAKKFMKAGFDTLQKKLVETASPEEKEELLRINQIVYK